MDPLSQANVQAFLARGRDTTPRGRRSQQSTPRGGLDFEKQHLADARTRRSKMTFLQRMEADKNVKDAYVQVCSFRKNLETAKRMDKMVEQMRRDAPSTEPRIVSISSKDLWHGHGKKQEWAPLEYY